MVASGPVWMSELRLQSLVFCCRVSSLVTWVTVSSTRVMRNLGAGVCVYRRCISFQPVFLINWSILFLMKRQSSCRLLEKKLDDSTL